MKTLDLFDMVHDRASFQEFEAAAKKFFRAQFKALNCVGATLTRNQWLEKDNSSPFFILCQDIADMVVERYEFNPLIVALTGSENGPEMAPLDIDEGAFYGLRISTHVRCVNVLMYVNSTKVEVSYMWPELKTVLDAYGEVCGESSHASKDFAFDLTNPESVGEIIECVLGKCELMVRGEPA